MLTCEVCGKELVLRLDADFAASGVWCNHCGVSFGDPQESFPEIPPGLFDLAEGWNVLWEATNEKQSRLIKEPMFELLLAMGKQLKLLFEEYCPCTLRIYNWIDGKWFYYEED